MLSGDPLLTTSLRIPPAAKNHSECTVYGNHWSQWPWQTVRCLISSLQILQ